jgi:hypothetical protein
MCVSLCVCVFVSVLRYHHTTLTRLNCSYVFQKAVWDVAAAYAAKYDCTYDALHLEVTPNCTHHLFLHLKTTPCVAGGCSRLLFSLCSLLSTLRSPLSALRSLLPALCSLLCALCSLLSALSSAPYWSLLQEADQEFSSSGGDCERGEDLEAYSSQEVRPAVCRLLSPVCLLLSAVCCLPSASCH